MMERMTEIEKKQHWLRKVQGGLPLERMSLPPTSFDALIHTETFDETLSFVAQIRNLMLSLWIKTAE